MVQKAIRTTILTLTGVTATSFLLGLSSIGGYVNASATGESASLSSSGVNFEITPTSANPNGTVAIGTDELTVSSTCSSGYKLYISTTSNEEGSNTLENVDIEDGSSTTAPTSIPITTGTISSPTLLNAAASKNHWGFAMASGDTGIASTGFDASTNATVTNNSLFASIPLLDNMSTIRQKTSSTDNETVNVYYGVNVGTDLAPGSYSSTVMYTMVMPSPCDYTLMFEDGVFDSDPIESAVTKMPESTSIGRNTEVNLGNYINEFSREGYSITGWKNLTDDLTYTKDQVVNINTNNSDIIKLSPIWTLNTYTITLNSGTGITNTTITVTKDTNPDTTNNKTGTTTTDTNPTVTVGYKSTIQIGYTVSNGYHFIEWEITSVDTDEDGNPLLTKDDLTHLSGTDATNNSIYSFTVPTSSVTLTAKAEGNKYTVHFNSNGGTGEMADVQMTYGSPSTLPENTFTNGDYDFYGWSKTQQDPSTDPTRDYTDGQTGVFNLTTSSPSDTGESTLYAVWKQNVEIMQNWKGCTDLTISTTENYEDKDTYADLLDTRNNVTYRVRRYSDQNCWMAENLRVTPLTSDPGTSTISSGTLATITSTSEAAGSVAFTSSFSITSYTRAQGIYKGNNTYGAYYSWTAAKLVCPAGWTLPTNTQYSTFLSSESIADSSDGSIKIRSAPYNFSYAGYYGGTSLGSDGSNGFYWSSVQYDSSRGYYLSFHGTRALVNYGNKYNGFSVRCVQVIPPSTSMQDFRSDECAALVASTTENYNNTDTYTTRIDTRNNVAYTIRKYSDGLCWMANNLRVTPLTSDPGTSTVNSGTLTTTTSTSEATGSVSFTSSFSTSGYPESQGIYLGDTTYGAYYSWTAAKLVCPAGWTLPTNTQYSNFLSKESIADSSAGSTKIRSAPYNFSYAGYYNGSSLYGDDSGGSYWSSVQYDSSRGYRLGFSSSYAYVTHNNENYGSSVRCVHTSS